jgi:hypothetical protein
VLGTGIPDKEEFTAKKIADSSSNSDSPSLQGDSRPVGRQTVHRPSLSVHHHVWRGG